MASLIGKHNLIETIYGTTKAEQEFSSLITNRAQVELCSREYTAVDQTALEAQMIEYDNFGNNPLHFAFRTKKRNTIDLMIRAGYGEIDHRN